jgi:hypothetical protein
VDRYVSHLNTYYSLDSIHCCLEILFLFLVSVYDLSLIMLK